MRLSIVFAIGEYEASLNRSKGTSDCPMDMQSSCILCTFLELQRFMSWYVMFLEMMKPLGSQSHERVTYM